MDDQPPTDRAPAREAFSVLAVFLALGAMLTALVGAGFGLRAIDESRDAVAAGASGGGSGVTAMVPLKEFSVAPVTVPVGSALHVMNEGTAIHNLAIAGTDIATADLASGEDEQLALTALSAGTYTMFCTIPGHRDAGMSATLTVSDSAGGAPSAAAGEHGGMDYEAMTKAMTDTMGQFPAATEGTGNVPLEPTTVLADGTKVFDLVAEIVPWERGPGDVVDAWTYNGVVPAPSIRLAIGDKAEFRLRNDLPIATDLHLHGLNVDNAYDGVAPLTQPLVEPGHTFSYRYTADEVAVAMYHPHFHSQVGMPNGMFGTILVGRVALPTGQTITGVDIPEDVTVSQELPMVLNDSGVIGYSLNGKSFPATAPVVAKAGEWVLFHYFNEGSQIHPMHLHQFDQIVVAKDGYALDHPYMADTVNVAPGERYSVLVHLDKPGTWVWHCHILPHVEGEDGMFGMVTAVVVQ